MELAFLVPGALDQLTGGYLYDRQVVHGLRARGHQVQLVELAGRHPEADEHARQAATAALASLPDGTIAVIDGLALPAFAPCLTAEAARLRLVGFIHHPLSLETGLGPADAARYATLEADLWPRLRGAICPSPHTARHLLAAGLATGRVAIAPPGTAKPASSSPRRAKATLDILTVGTLTPRKGHRLLIDALAGLRELDWHLTCIGSLERAPGSVNALRAAITAHGLEERVALLGEQPAERLAEAYRHADLFALPSFHEGYGMVFTEALAHGLPIVATTAGAIPDTVPADAALLVPPGDVAALRGALQQLLSDAALRSRRAAGARGAAAVLPDWDQAIDRWAAALDQVAA
ncbi:MAG: glycosyltransferase family 4 protein [Proteobacteria bacterium]|nr:glycosyltransferase family 4 protein [Pseudomonadota bacterium]